MSFFLKPSAGDTGPASGISRWKFEQDLLDAWDGNDLTDNTSSGYVSGTVGDYAKSFNGSGDYLSVPDSTVPNDFSLSVWVDLDAVSDGTHCVIFSSGQSGEPSSFVIYATTDFGGANNQSRVVGDGTEILGPDIRGNGWTHLVFGNSGSSNELYINGNLEGTMTQSYNIGPIQYIGTYRATGRYYQGSLDDPRVYNKLLSSSEVSNLYNNGHI